MHCGISCRAESRLERTWQAANVELEPYLGGIDVYSPVQISCLGEQSYSEQ